jgi:hypothetical protein
MHLKAIATAAAEQALRVPSAQEQHSTGHVRVYFPQILSFEHSKVAQM